MSNEVINAFVEGRGSLGSLERAIDESHNPLLARAEFEKELAAEWAFKNLFATIPPPLEGLPRVLAALRGAPAPMLSADRAETLAALRGSLRATLHAIPEPAGGYAAAMARLKSKLAAAPAPFMVRSTDMDIQVDLDQPATGTQLGKKTRRPTEKIVRMPQHSQRRDVLAAGQDLPENPDDLPNA